VTNPLLREVKADIHCHHTIKMRMHSIMLVVLFPKGKTLDLLFHYSLNSAVHVDRSLNGLM
jgi:hypothetical protein